MTLLIKLDKSHNLLQMRLDKFYNPIMLRTDLDIGSDIRLICKLAKFLTETSSKVYKPKTYDEVINNLIYRNKWYKTIDEELWKLNLYQI